MICYGCYKQNTEGYCPECRKSLFDGKQVSHVLSFNMPRPDNLQMYQEKTKRLSTSGVQLKYSLRRSGKQLLLTETGGEYILKPVPPSTHLTYREETPENEHLTMQIASRLFGISVAANGLIYFKDGSPAYITRRFDVKSGGGKHQQEDMAQISGRSRNTHGGHFKYDGTYEEIGQLIRQHVAASMPALEDFFRIVLFNYLFSNGDAHLKNFSLLRSDMGDFTLSPAYDLLCAVLHTPLESDTALDLYPKSMGSPFYDTYGYYGQSDFRALADRIRLVPSRRDKIITQLLSASTSVIGMIRQSLLSDELKEKYIQTYQDKRARLEMIR